jgi:transposase
VLRRFQSLYHRIITQGLAFHDQKPALTDTPKRRIGHNLLIRLRDFKDAVLRCLFDPSVPFTNNLAERDIRMMKVKQKISTLRSLLSTAAKQNLNLLQTIKNAFAGQPPPIPV